MTNRIRRVTVELLRQGPRHNQLLSPLTNYLAVCGQFPAGVVNVAYEQTDILNILEELRYVVASADRADRLAAVRERTGTELAKLLGSIPGVPGSLTPEVEDTTALTHLRIVLSASELALLPFELAKVPVGAGNAGVSWLALRPGQPVCITRHVRGATEGPTRWPIEPRLLFVSGADVPFASHLDALARVLSPWQEVVVPDGGESVWTCGTLTVIRDASLDAVRAATADTHFTHVHVLAHGSPDPEHLDTRHGILLRDQVVFGEQLASALSTPTRDGVRLPTVVTLAACDSGAQGSVVTQTGSVAHDLHAAGIPLVVASQFPISKDASVPFVEEFLGGDLGGAHPLVSLYRVRRRLDAGFTDEHAWASIVAYESLPDDLDAQLEEVRYWQTRRALDHALSRLEGAAAMAPGPSDSALADYCGAIDSARNTLPDTGPFALECGGLRAASWKRTAEVWYRLSQSVEAPLDVRAGLIRRSRSDLETGLALYRDVLNQMLTSSGDVHHRVTVHWVAVQVLMLQVVLGLPSADDLDKLAGFTARLDSNHADRDVRAWANASLAELALLALADAPPDEQAAAAKDARDCAQRIVDLVGRDSEQVRSSARQFLRYSRWWGSDAFVESLDEKRAGRRQSWAGENGVRSTAEMIIQILTGGTRHEDETSRAASRVFGEPPAQAQRREFRAPVEPGEAAVPARRGSLEVEMLPSGRGDCLWVSYGENSEQHHLLIDCGTGAAADAAAERIRAADRVEMFVLTHIDADHIGGAIPLLSDHSIMQQIDDVWFNGWRQLRGFLSVRQAEQFSAMLEREDREFLWNRTERSADSPPAIEAEPAAFPQVETRGGMRLTVLSPTRSTLRRLAAHWQAALSELGQDKEMLAHRPPPRLPTNAESLDLESIAATGPTRDSSIPNGSSIAVLAEFGGRAVLFTGDAHADVLAVSIRALQSQRGRAGQRLRLDALKVSHHGSANATTAELLSEIECSTYLVSTDGGLYYHPDLPAIARIVVSGGPSPALHFNYRSEFNSLWESPELQARYRYTARYPDTEGAGLKVAL